jgi:hypothetical protein
MSVAAAKMTVAHPCQSSAAARSIEGPLRVRASEFGRRPSTIRWRLIQVKVGGNASEKLMLFE